MSTQNLPLDPALDWNEPQFGILRACTAIHCSTQWLNTMFNRKPVVYPLLPEERVQVGDRNYFILPFRRVFHLALIRDLRAVMPFATTRDLSKVCVDSDHLWPADLKPDGRPRYLVIAPATGESVMRVRGEGEPDIRLDDLFSDKADGEPRIVLNVTPIFDRVVEGLDIHKRTGELIPDDAGELAD
jgi:hypothetical protein